MNKLIRVLVSLLVLLTASTTSPAATENDALLRITQHQTRCCYMEGQVSFVQLLDESGEAVADLEFTATGMITPVLDQRLPAGSYTLRSWQRSCSGNCGRLDPPSNECEMALELVPGSDTFITSAFAPGEGCSITETAQPLGSPIPDSFALREQVISCGEEFPPIIALGIQGRSPALTCFLQAWESGTRAEITAWARISENAVRPRYQRILPDRRIEVFVPPDDPRIDASWFYYQCDGLVADEEAVFVLQGCAEPEILTE